MPDLPSVLLNLVAALGIGLLIGAERERRKEGGPARSPAGIRTFTIASLAGAASVMTGGAGMLAVTVTGVAVLTAIAYLRSRSDDPGLTTEIALIVTALLGGMAMQQPVLAAGMAVGVAALLAARTPLHHFVRSVLTEREVNDAMIFAGATLVVLPLLPDQALGPYGALNPRSIWIVVILVMAISAAGYVLVRILGARFGLPLAGFASGFISSAATIGAMGARAQKSPDVVSAAVAGAALSTVATVIQMCLVLAATSPATLRALSAPLICAGIAAAAYGAGFTLRALRERDTAEPQPGQRVQPPGRAGIRPHPFRGAHRLGRATGMVRRDRSHCSGGGGRLRRHAFPRHRDCFAGCIRKDGRCRRRVSYSRRVLHQYDQQDHLRLEQRQPVVRVATDPGPDPGCRRGVGRHTADVMADPSRACLVPA